nr:hypothetical protein [uncultured Albidiferax sp.]
MREPLLAQGMANYRQIDDEALKALLAYEIALTRGAELTLAYRNVIMVFSGQRRRRYRGRERLQDESCVVFLVRKKWNRKDKKLLKDAQALPNSLLTFVEWRGERMLVAVPTDVQTAEQHAAVRPQGQSAVCVRRQGHIDEYGTVAVGLSNGQRALSALHVLTPHFTSQGTLPVANSKVEFAAGRPQPLGPLLLGSSSAQGGRLVPAPAISLDAQIIDVSNVALLGQMLASMRISSAEPYVASVMRFHQLRVSSPSLVIEILAPLNRMGEMQKRNRMFAAFSSIAPHSFSVPYRATDGILDVVHWELVELDVLGGQQTLGGDSGSAVVFWRPDGTATLIGMHVAGTGNRSHVVPAWLLFSPNADDAVPLAGETPSGL